LAEAWVAANREFEETIAFIDTEAPDSSKSKSPIFKRVADLQFERIRPNIEREADGNLSLDIKDINEAVASWGKRERERRAKLIINYPDYSIDDDGFKRECELVGACGHKISHFILCPPIMRLTQNFVSDLGLKIPAMHGAMFAVQRLLEIELKRVLEEEAEWRNGNYSSMLVYSSAYGPSKNNEINAPNGMPHIRLLDLIETYIKTNKKPIKTAGKLRMACRYIIDVFGYDCTVEIISKKHLLDLQIKATRLPARLTISERKQSLIELEKKFTDDAIRPKLTTQAIRSWFNLLGSFFNLAVKADFIAKNPVDGIKPKANGHHVRRLPFSRDDMKSIFAPKYYPQAIDASKYWIPLLALYTGARLNELGQLHKTDIFDESTPCIDINDDNAENSQGKRLKNASSRRVIPIHNELLRLGFMDYVRSCKGPYIFPDLPHGGKYEPTKAFSQWFGRFIRTRGVLNKAKVFHSFRHSFKDECRANGVEEEVHDAITGHTNPTRSIGRSYGTGIAVSRLEIAINSLYLEAPHRLTPIQMHHS